MPDAADDRSRGGRPRRDQAGEVERRLLAAATEAFLTKGFDATSCDEVARVAGAGKASLYARFRNKEALFAAVLKGLAATPVDPAGRWSRRPLRGRLRGVGLAILEDASQPRTAASMRLIISVAPRFPEITREAGRIGWSSGAARVKAAALAGPDAPTDADAVAERYVDLIFPPHQLRLLLGEDAATLAAAAEARVETSLDLLLGPSGEPSSADR